VERSHQEAMRERGLLLRDVFQSFAGDWVELLPVVEFVLYNSPRLDTG